MASSSGSQSAKDAIINYVGLSNQGATCYMNSLLQTLFMTTDFRKSLYSWCYDKKKHQGEQDCIPLQLQKLFAELQTKTGGKSYAETRGLTKSFQWDVRQGFEQHDVQEFCRVLFDAIEESCKGTSQENFINELYEGVLFDYVQCRECKFESKREDKFLDLSLTIKNPFENIHNDSVQKALENYLKPEILEKGNQYHCEKCDKKVDAVKGLKFKHFPKILTLQLKRFDLDYNTMHRIKLNDFVSFPAILNLNRYLRGYEPAASTSKVEDTPMKGEDDGSGSQSSSSGAPKLRRKLSDNLGDIDLNTIGWVSEDAKPEEITKREQELQSYIEEALSEGEFVYELYSIMIHSGSALGGHYYAYIKSFEDSKWYSFNDSMVKNIAVGDIPRVFGGKRHAGTMSYEISTNAYLLMYRKVEPGNTTRCIPDSEIPEYIADILKADVDREEQERKEREERLNLMDIRVYYQNRDEIIKTKRNHTLRELIKLAHKTFELTVPVEHCRLRYYNVHASLLQETYDGREDEQLQALRVYSYTSLGLETKGENEEWKPYDPSAYQIRVVAWDEELSQSENIDDEIGKKSKVVEVKKTILMRELVEKISALFSIPKEELIILRKNASYERKLVDILNTQDLMERSLHLARIYDGVQLHVERHEEGAGVRIKDSKFRFGLHWEDEFELQNNKIILKVNSPHKSDADIPDYDIKVTVDNRMTAGEFKATLAKKFDLQEDDFLFKRGGRNGVEIKDLTQKISHINLYQNAVVYLEKGFPTKQGERRLVFYLVDEDLTSKKEIVSWKFSELFELPLSENFTLAEAKVFIAKAAKEQKAVELDPELFRIREKSSDRLGKVFKDDEQLKDMSLYERKSFAIQRIDKAESLPKDHLLLLTAYIDTSTWQFGQRSEVIIKKNLTLNDFGAQLSQNFNIDPENLMATRLISTYSFTMQDLQSSQWFKLHDSPQSLSGSPWYLSYDGVLFIVKDTKVQAKPLTAADKSGSSLTSWAVTSSGGPAYSSSSSSSRYSRRTEKALKITVKKREDEAEVEAEEGKSDDEETTATEKTQVTSSEAKGNENDDIDMKEG